ncbi:MAG: sigma-70 family RNA polymerase sigma factor [Halioglobus sp.]|nr:sigma-70 family RNA polymerase sigma factor [Halioglobus sp.]
MSDRDDNSAEWLFSQSSNFPLLRADEEQQVDAQKWHAVEQLQQLFVTDAPARRYLALWATNLRDRPPQIGDFAVRDHYKCLRREQQHLLEDGASRKALEALARRLERPAKQEPDHAAIAEIHMGAALTAGIAEVLLGSDEAHDTARALLHWQAHWPQDPQQEGAQPGARTRKQVAQALRLYHEAREKLVVHNMRLVYSIAGRINSRGLPYPDLVQSGMLGLLRAAEKYDHRRGYRFSTYAYNWINQTTRQLVEDMQGIVRYPGGLNDKLSRLYRERMHLLASTGREPRTEELAARLKMKPEAVDELRQVSNLSLSIDARAGNDDDGVTLGETLAGGPYDDTAKAAQTGSLRRCLLNGIDTLAKAEQRVIMLRWGLSGSQPLSRREIALQMQVSTEWVRQLEASAMAKLRNDPELVAVFESQETADT